MTTGLTSEGFAVKLFEDVQADVQAELKSGINASINLAPRSNFGQITGIMANLAEDLWQLAAAVYDSQYPDTASGTSLDNVCAITGTVREQPTATTVTATLTGTPATVVPAGTVFSVAVTGTKFETDEDATLDGGGNADVACTAQETGPKVCNSGTLTVIDTPVAGLSSVTNALDATVLGTDLETDAALRVRRENELAASANASVDSIREKVLQLDDVTDCYVLENVTDLVDADSIPAHAIEVVVEGGDQDEIATAVYATKAAGIATAGTTTRTVTDSQGFTHSVKFTRPTLEPIYIIVNLTKDSNWNPSTGPAAVKAALVAYAAEKYRVGSDVVDAPLYVPVFSVAGVVDITSLYIGLAPAPASSTTLPMTIRQLAQFDTSRITVNAS